MKYQIVLGSSSPYRKKCLGQLSVDFIAASPDIDETPILGETAMNLVRRLSVAKAEALAPQYKNALIIGSDQVAVLKGEILGKPGNHENAVIQLKKSSGSVLTLHAGVALYHSVTNEVRYDSDTFEVEFKPLTDSQIETYLRLETPYDCCGSLKADGPGITLLKRLTGDDPNTLIGLPLIKLVHMLEREGINLN